MLLPSKTIYKNKLGINLREFLDRFLNQIVDFIK